MTHDQAMAYRKESEGPSYVPPKLENGKQVKKRLETWLEDLVRDAASTEIPPNKKGRPHNIKHVLVVTHAGVIRTLLSQYTKTQLPAWVDTEGLSMHHGQGERRKLDVPNTSVTILDIIPKDPTKEWSTYLRLMTWHKHYDSIPT